MSVTALPPSNSPTAKAMKSAVQTCCTNVGIRGTLAPDRSIEQCTKPGCAPFAPPLMSNVGPQQETP